MTDKEYRKAKRDVAVPIFFKRKIFMVLMLLVCSGIMAVAATYAWFILSTTPEVSGISTTVGANGSLEIALLNNETGVNTSLIRADVGDSISIVGAVQGNVTWGNLVDISDASYGLNTIVMYPSVLNVTDNKLDTTAMLSIPKNGVDGRISSISSNTAPAIYNGSAFTTVGANYGVRAIGSVGNVSNREASLASAKSGFLASQNSAKATAQNAISAYGTTLISAAMGGSNATYTYEQLSALKSMCTDLKNALDYVLTSYKQAIIANAAARSTLSDSDFELIRSGVSDATAGTLSSYASQYAGIVSGEDLNALATAIASADVAIDVANNLLFTNYGTDEQEPVAAGTVYTFAQVSPIINKIADLSTISLDSITATSLILTPTAGGGLLTAVADYVGNYSAPVSGISVEANTTKLEGAGLLSAVDLSALTAPAGTPTTSTNNSTVTTFYGYVVDLAFRTNVAADLQLQTAAIDRIYTDGAGATAGKGSGVIYTFPAGMNDVQINAMLAAVRVVFFDPDTGTIYARGKLSTPTVTRPTGGTTTEATGTATASLYLLTGDGSALQSDNAPITSLELATPKKLSVLVYLDGTMLNNVSVFNGSDSGTLLMNFQFGSSADLKPMVDSELKNSTGTGG